MNPASYELRILHGLTGAQLAAILGRVNEEHPPAALHWSEHGLVCAFVAETWPPILKDRVDRALAAELGPTWHEKVEAIGATDP